MVLFFRVCIKISVLYHLPPPWIIFVLTFFTIVWICNWKIVSDFIFLKESLFFLHLKDLFAGYIIFGWQFSSLTIKMSLHDLTCIISESMCFFVVKFIYLFLVVLGLHCRVQTFSSCNERELLFIVVLGLLIAVACLVAEHRL